MQVGLKLFAELYSPLELVRQAVVAEQAGFDFVEMSDHFHPWLDQSDDLPLAGHSGFAWSVLAMVAARTSSIRFGTGVTCPTVRYHPAIIAQAAATMSILSEGRFFLGIGSGERLNEHIVGRGWHSVAVRQEMLREALHIITMLWSGGFHSFHGKHLQLEDARVYDLPDELPEILVAAGGPNAARIAADYGGMFTSSTTPDPALVKVHREQGGSGTIFGEMFIAYDPDSKEAGLRAGARSARWAALGVQALPEIPRASAFESATQFIQTSDLANAVVAGPEAADYVAQAEKFAAAGIDGLAFVNCSPDIDKFIDFAAEHLIETIHGMKTA
ncbi:TIGR03557 family F420-dependent LLM class oxidoreductase [Mycobacterium sp. NPDC048908]|uniref:TIGR03557 family F420-dependent LLM class oxidoreductase n=1 Tax=Mycobacterium sp. NPDC048908 TaxID=3364292 RepID=UPI00371A6C20